jgi:hypothetical protein
MNIFIEIEGICIPDNVKNTFLEQFLENITNLNNIENIDSSICNTLASTLYKKPTDMLHSTYKKIKDSDTNSVCNICFASYSVNEYKRELNCKHFFHKKCIDKLLNKYNHTKCPLCRKNVFSIVHQHI